MHMHAFQKLSCFIGLGIMFTAGYVSAIQVACGLEGISDWMKSMPFKDALKMCRDYRVVPATSEWDYTHAHLGRTDDGAAISQVSLRADGYPTQIPSNGNRVLTLCLVGIPSAMYPFGTFTLLFEGTGQIYLGWDAGGRAPAGFTQGFIPDSHGHYVNGTGGATQFQFSINSGSDFFGYYGGSTTTSTGILVHIMSSSAADPVRNIRLIIPDAQGGTSNLNNYEAQPFNPVFLEDHRPFTVFRFMDWGATNNSNVTTWNQRMTPSTFFAARTALGGCGAAYEYMVDLCNLLRRDLWVCVPHRADANYRTQLAQLIHGRLDTGRKVYVEYSNETWNGLFQQTGYCSSQADALGLGTGSLPSWTKSGVYQVYAAVRIWSAFETAFGGSSRLVKVLSGWHINTDFTDAMLWALGNSTVNPNDVSASACATAPYMPYSGEIGSTIPMDVIYNYMYSTKLPEIGQHARAQRTRISGAGLTFLTYEAGQHVLGNEAKQREFNNDPRMYALYRAYLDTLGNNGVAMMNQFVAVSGWGFYGCWGAKEYAGQPMAQAHKYRALYDYLVADDQFDPNEAKYWESVATMPREASARPRLSLSRETSRFYWLNGRLIDRGQLSERAGSPGALSVPGVAVDQNGVIVRAK
jgi:hypothetical protein